MNTHAKELPHFVRAALGRRGSGIHLPHHPAVLRNRRTGVAARHNPGLRERGGRGAGDCFNLYRRKSNEPINKELQ